MLSRYHKYKYSPVQHYELVGIFQHFYLKEIGWYKNRQGISPLCFTPQQACCSDSSQTKHDLTEPLFSVTGCLTYSVLTFIKRKHCFQEPQWAFNFYLMTVFSSVMTCMCLDPHWTRAVSVSGCHSQALCQLWTKYDCNDCHVSSCTRQFWLVWLDVENICCWRLWPRTFILQEKQVAWFLSVPEIPRLSTDI